MSEENFTKLSAEDTEYVLSAKEKLQFKNCFDLTHLDEDDKKDVMDIIMEYPRKYPVLVPIIREAISKNLKFGVYRDNILSLEVSVNAFAPILDDIRAKKQKPLDLGLLGKSEWTSEIWFKVIDAVNKKEKEQTSSIVDIAAEIYNVAEMRAYESMFNPRYDFEKEMYKESLERNDGNILEAQKKYIATYTLQYMQPNRFYAQLGVFNNLGVFPDCDDAESARKSGKYGAGLLSEDSLRHRMYFRIDRSSYKPTNDLSANDIDVIQACETTFQNRYGLKMSLMSSINEEMLQYLDYPTELLLTPTRENIYDRKKWRDFGRMALDFGRYPFADAGLVEKILKDDGFISVERGGEIRHSNGFSSRSISFSHNGKDLLEKMFQKVENQQKELTDKEVSHDGTPIKGATFAFDAKNPPILYLGSKENVLPLKYVLTADMKNHLENGAVLLIGRDIDHQFRKPEEIASKPYKKYDCPDVDNRASRLHGYITASKDGKYRYTDCSTNGTYVKAVESRGKSDNLMEKTIRNSYE